jgi:hypothetical protein
MLNLSLNTLNANVLLNNSITGSKLINNTITATQIANNTITNAQIANNTITATQIANNTITNAQIANNTITNAQIANNTIGIQQLFTDFNTRYCPFMNRTNDGNTGLMFSSSTASNTPYNWITNNFHAYAAITPSTLGIKSGLNASQLKFGLNSGLFFATPNYYNTVNNGDNGTFQTILICPSNNAGCNNNGSGNGNVLLKG